MHKQTIPDIFEEHGEVVFRGLETGLLTQISRKDGQIVSTGGGVPTIPKNVKIMNCTGKIVCLKASVETLSKRISHHSNTAGDKADRPMLYSGDRTERIRDLLDIRRESYNQADLLVDTEDKSPKMVAIEIAEALKL